MQLEMRPSDVNRFNPANSQVHINFPGQLGSLHRIKKWNANIVGHNGSINATPKYMIQLVSYYSLASSSNHCLI